MKKSFHDFLKSFLQNTAGKYFKKLAFLFIIGSISAYSVASPPPLLAKSISGQVTNQDGAPLTGVTISLKGTNISAISDNTGSFKINIPDEQNNPILIFSSAGYLGQEVTIGRKSFIDVKLIRDIKNLNEVVVVGYGTQKRKDLTGSIASVSSAQIDERPVSSYEDALAGVAAGIDVAPRSARPGNTAEITIRGIGTISGDREPLFVVDGFPTDALNAAAINPSNIASVDILKDASSTAIYGSRGANGVIIITTKSGKTGHAKLDVDIKTGFSQANKHDFYHVLDGAQYVEWYKEAALNNGTPIPSWVTNWDGTSTNWQDIIYKPAPFQNYGLSASGGTDKVTYFISGNYLDQGDILLNGGYKKYSMRMKVDYKPSKRITIGVNLAPNYTAQRQSAPEDDYSSLTGDAVLLPPIIPAYNKDGTPTDVNSFGVLAFNMVNPLTIAENYKWTQNNFYVLGDAYLQVEIAKGLSARTSIGANVSDNKYQLFQKEGMMGQALSPVTSLALNSERTINWLNQNTLNYKATFNDVHKLELLAGYTVQKVTYEAVGATANSFPSPLGQTIGFGTVQQGNSAESGNSLLSYLARANYSYKDKYLLTATIRRDGSSRFGINNLWGTFPSIAGAWVLSNEKFMEKSKVIDNAKIRLSYGSTGSNFIGDFTSKASLRAVNSSFGNNPVIGFVNNDPGNPNLSWEKSNQVDVGADLSLFNRVTMTLDYFNNVSQGLLLAVNTPASTGYSTDLENIGKMRKWGYEMNV